MRHNLTQARRKAHLTKAQTARKIGVSARQYARLEAGVSNGSMRVWQRLRQLLGTPIDTLIENTTE